MIQKAIQEIGDGSGDFKADLALALLPANIFAAEKAAIIEALFAGGRCRDTCPAMASGAFRVELSPEAQRAVLRVLKDKPLYALEVVLNKATLALVVFKSVTSSVVKFPF